jgi:hypothetical protein
MPDAASQIPALKPLAHQRGKLRLALQALSSKATPCGVVRHQSLTQSPTKSVKRRPESLSTSPTSAAYKTWHFHQRWRK